jgi:hypothetical protein
MGIWGSIVAVRVLILSENALEWAYADERLLVPFA